jgi:hypothetical protein
LEQVPEGISQARLVRDGCLLDMEWQDSTCMIVLPEDLRDPFDTVIELS